MYVIYFDPFDGPVREVKRGVSLVDAVRYCAQRNRAQDERWMVTGDSGEGTYGWIETLAFDDFLDHVNGK